MDDVIPTTRRMTYAELAEARNITTGSAEQLARRRRWPRQLGNDGMVRVLVPLGEDHASPRDPRHKGPNKGPMKSPDIGADEGPVSSPLYEGPMTAPDIREVIGQAIRDAVAPLRGQLDIANQRAERSEAERRELQAKLEHERELAADAAAAARIARDEAAGLRTRLDQLQARGLWARLRNKR